MKATRNALNFWIKDFMKNTWGTETRWKDNIKAKGYWKGRIKGKVVPVLN
jgi:hypothetical protein